jgi:MYXO-CTERM domain-containing protein
MSLLLLATLAQGQELTFVVVGDVQTDGNHSSINWDVFPQLVEDMNAHEPQLGLFVGDLVGGASSVSATQAQWLDFKSVVAGFDGQVLAVPGNHDVYGGAGTFQAWRETFPWLPTDNSPAGEEGVSYVWDEGDVRFVSVTSDQENFSPTVSEAGMGWLRQVLQDSGSFNHTFVITHHPVSFSTEGGLGTTSSEFWQTLVANDVTGLFVGHWHRYQPGQLGNGGDTWETIIGTGGGWQGFEPIRPYQQVHGYLLVKVDGPEAVATFYGDADGDGHYDDPLDSFVMASAQPEPPGVKAFYGMEDSQDAGPHSLSLSLVGDAELVDSPRGQALALDGSGDWALAGGIQDYHLALLGDLSVSMWVRSDGLQSGDWGNTLITYATNDYYSEDEETNYAYWLSVQDSGHVRAFWEHDNGVNVTLDSTAPGPFADGDWHHLVMTRDADAQVLRFFVDGQGLGEALPFDRLPTGANRGMLYMGADTTGATPFSGGLDQVCVLNRVLETAEIEGLSDGVLCTELEDEPQDTGPNLEDSGVPDTSTDPELGPLEPDGCGCSSKSGGSMAWLLALGFVFVLRRQSKNGAPEKAPF